MIPATPQLIAVYNWPYSQICSECVHGAFIQGDHIGDACYSCLNDEAINYGSECTGFESNEERGIDCEQEYDDN